MYYNQKLPKEVEKKLDDYIVRIKKINWFKPAENIKKEDVENQVKLCCEAFKVKANPEFKYLKTPQDWGAAWNATRDAARDAAWNAARNAAWDAAWDAAWNAARDAAWDAAWDAARNAAWNVAQDAAWNAARDAAWDAAWDAARDAVSGALDLLALNLEGYKKKYPKGNFINLIPFWEMGLYPVGIVNKKFIIYVSPRNLDFPKELK